jgi:thiosulfate/3-mercaptopyruvate sulfurtransferase
MIIVDSKWLASHLDDDNLCIIDARGGYAHGFGHIKNSQPLDVEQVISISENGSNLVIEKHVAENLFSSLGIDGSKTVVVYGEYPDPSAARVVWTLHYYGHEKANLLDVGYFQWQKGGLPISKYEKPFLKKITKVSDDTNIKFTAKINLSIRADAHIIKEKQNDSNAIIIDARTPQEHFQARILGSLLNNWEEGLGNNGKMIKDKDGLKEYFISKGITPDKEIICYCHAGIRASHTYIQFKHAGFNKVRLYDGSIIDWAQRRNPLR